MIIQLTQENLHTVEQASKAVIDVSASWCGPCIQMKPIFEDVANGLKDKYIFAELNVDESREIAIKYGITSVPTFLFIKNGQVTGKETGYLPKEDLIAKIEYYLS